MKGEKLSSGVRYTVNFSEHTKTAIKHNLSQITQYDLSFYDTKQYCHQCNEYPTRILCLPPIESYSPPLQYKVAFALPYRQPQCCCCCHAGSALSLQHSKISINKLGKSTWRYLLVLVWTSELPVLS